jgi:aminopeptidase N
MPGAVTIGWRAVVLCSVLVLSSSAEATDVRAVRYEVELALDFATASIAGAETVVVRGAGAVDLHAGDLSITEASLDGVALPFAHADGRVRFSVPPTVGDKRVQFRYRAKPTRGLRISAMQAFTAFHTDHWMVCDMDPDQKATLQLAIIVPKDLTAVGSGEPAGRDVLDGDRVRYRFSLERPHSAYLFGFAAGKFEEATSAAGAVALRYVGTPFRSEELQRIFHPTSRMLAFFEDRAGVPFPSKHYAQVLMPNGPAQEMAELSVMSDRYGRSLLDDPREDYLVAHELAHQWWGNLVTCRTWSDFWLNEGMATFMVAAFKEHFWGRDEYHRELAMARLRYENALERGLGRSLVYTKWKTSDEMGGPVTYSRGALVLHLLRRELGDPAFWTGIREYTRAHAGGSVVSSDLRAALENASGRDLRTFFDQWVTGEVPSLSAKHRVTKRGVEVEIEQKQASVWRFSVELAVQTATQRVTRRVEVTKRRQTFRVAVAEPVLSIVVDAPRDLPDPIAHGRPLSMLLTQTEIEPELSVRLGAMRALEKACAGLRSGEPCAKLVDALGRSATHDVARLGRMFAQQMLERLRASAAN